MAVTEIIGNICWMKLFCYTLLGFMTALTVFSLMICIIPCLSGCVKGPTHQEQIEKNISNKIEGIAGKLDCCRRVKRVTYQKAVFTIVLCVVILLPVAVGLAENEKCYGILIHIFLGILGMACGLLISFFIWSSKKQDDINATRPVEQSLLETVTIL